MPVRPKSIVRFEIAFWLSIVLGVAQTALLWNVMLRDPRFVPLVERTGTGLIYAIVFVILLLLIALWYLIARRGSVIAKWVFVLLTAYTIYDGVTGLLANGMTTALPGILSIVLIVVQTLAAVLLFMPDTRAWFGEEPAEAA